MKHLLRIIALILIVTALPLSAGFFPFGITDYNWQPPAAPISLTRTSGINDTDVDVTWTNPSGTVTGAYYKIGSAPTTDTDGTFVSGAQLTSISNIDVSGQDYGTVTIYVWLSNTGSQSKDTATTVTMTHVAPAPADLTSLTCDTPTANPTLSTTFTFSWVNGNPAPTVIRWKRQTAPTSSSDYTGSLGVVQSASVVVSTGSTGTIPVYFWGENASGSSWATANSANAVINYVLPYKSTLTVPAYPGGTIPANDGEFYVYITGGGSLSSGFLTFHTGSTGGGPSFAQNFLQGSPGLFPASSDGNLSASLELTDIFGVQRSTGGISYTWNGSSFTWANY